MLLALYKTVEVGPHRCASRTSHYEVQVGDKVHRRHATTIFHDRRHSSTMPEDKLKQSNDNAGVAQAAVPFMPAEET